MALTVDSELNKHQLRLNRQRDDITGVQGRCLVLEERADSLGGESQELTARVESMSDKLCQCQDQVEVESFVRNIPTPALTYAGSEDSYHTPPPAGIIGDLPVRPPLVELSSGNDLNQENVRPSGRASGIPAGAVLVPISSDIELWDTPCSNFEEEEAFSDELDEQMRRRAFGLPVFSVGRQTCVKSKRRADPYLHRMAVGDRKQRRLRYITGLGASKRERRDLRSSEWVARKLECGYGRYESDRESSSSGLSDADAWEFHRSESPDVPSRDPPRAAPSNHQFVRPSTSCCTERSPGRGVIGAAEVLARALSEPQRIGGGDGPGGDDPGPSGEPCVA